MERVVASKTFARNPRLIALLAYLCEKSLDSAEQSIKEYDIATDVFQRPPAFDQTKDAIVRVEMHRLRKKLKEYYTGEGVADPIEIVLQAGKYLPEVVERTALTRTESQLIPIEDLEKAVALPETVSAVKRPFPIGWLLVVLLAAALGVGGSFLWLNQWRGKAAVGVPKSAALAPASSAIRILCGLGQGSLQDREGNVWVADAYFSGGSAIKLPVTPLYRTRDAALFRTARSGDFSYRIPLKVGTYELRLYFADTNYHPGIEMEGGEGTRFFSVRMNGAMVLRDFDMIAEAGPDTADVKVFKDVKPASDGSLHLVFVRQVGEPQVNAIEITPGVPGRLQPIRVVTQDRKFMDRSGFEWQPDNYFLGGRISSRYGVIAGPSDPQIYERERYGNFSYAIPVAQGIYDVTLYFAESFWGPDEPGGGGAGSRIFDVYCNGTTLLKDFDMFQETGPNRQIAKTFRGVRANAQGTLLLSFVPKKNYASVSAIQVVDERPKEPLP